MKSIIRRVLIIVLADALSQVQVSDAEAKGLMKSKDETMSCSAISYPYFGVA